MKIKSKIYIFFILLLNLSSYAQFNEYHPEVDWYTIETEHFFIHFHAGTERSAKVIAKIAEEIYDPVTSLYQYKTDKVHFVIKDIDDYANGATYFFDNKIEIWASALDTELRGTTHWLRNVISHEFTHMVQLQAAMKTTRTIPVFYFQVLNYEEERRPDVLYGYPNGIISYPIPFLNIPSWFAEGTAQYMRKEFDYDFWDSHRDMVLRSYALDNNMLTWNEMQVFGKTSLGNESVYNSGFALVNYIAEKYGEKTLHEINNNAKSFFRFTIDGAIKNAINVSAEDLYQEWGTFLKNDYKIRVENILKNPLEGKKLFDKGFANLYPKFSNKSNKLYFISNKNQDYFITSLYELDLSTNEEKLIQHGVFSTIDITKDDSTLIYSKISDDNKNLVKIHDLYLYDLSKKKETRLTYGLRANNPSFSNSNKQIAFIVQKDGTTNIHLMDSDGKNEKVLTDYKHGEQIFTPKFSSNDSLIFYDISLNDSRDIYSINIYTNEIKPILTSAIDERNPVRINDNQILYTSDISGIYNIYKYDMISKQSTQISNVLGGAFYPEIKNDTIVYSGYTSNGYKIYLIENINSVKDFSNSNYIIRKNKSFLTSAKNETEDPNFNWEKLKNFDDSITPEFTINKYSGKFTSLSILPIIRVDNYSKKNKGIELLKPGIFFYSSDMLNRFNIMGGATINTKWERDLFFILEYRDRILGLYQLGLKPEISLEAYNISRTSEQTLGLFPDSTGGQVNYEYKVPVTVDYNLLEFDIKATHKIFNDLHHLTFGFMFSRYESIIGSFILPDNTLYPATRETYLIGRQLSLKYKYEYSERTIDDDIDKIGTRLTFKYDYESNKFNPESEYNVEDGVLVPLYQNITFNRIELNLSQNYILPWFKHSLSYKLRLGATIGPTTDEFFDFYLGGLIGMKSYPFYAISGNEVAYLNINYRFPIVKNIDSRIGHLYIDKIFASVYADFGSAWSDKAFTFSGIKKGIGAELRIQMNSFYIFPTSFFINVAYSFDDFTRTTKVTKEQVKYGKEFRYYFGVLFDFDFIQDKFKF